MDENRFAVVGIRPSQAPVAVKRQRWYRGKPIASTVILSLVVLGCLCAPLLTARDPAYMNLANFSRPPGGQFPFGTDTMGRDIFAMIWYGGRVSLLVGFLSTLIATAIAILYGAVSALAPRWLDALLMHMAEIFLSIPSLLLVVLLQAVLGAATVWSISLVIGVTSWTSIAKVVRTEVRQLRACEYVSAARCMGSGFFHVLGRHLTPNFFPSILFMVVMNVRGAIVAESTLSFMGVGLPLSVISWGSMLSLSENALSGGYWWIILIPGVFLVATLVCVTGLGNSLRQSMDRRESNL